MSEWVGRSGVMDLGGRQEVVNMIKVVGNSQRSNKNDKTGYCLCWIMAIFYIL